MNKIKYKYPVVNSTKLITEYSQSNKAIVHFNAINLLWIKAIIQGSNNLGKPVIIAATEAKLDYLGGMKNFVDNVLNILSSYANPQLISIHLDHSYSFEKCIQAINLGFSSIMFDGSKLPIEENIKKLNKLSLYANKYNVSIEGEIGSIGGIEDGVIGMGINASPKEASLIKKTNINLLAAGIGNVHGKYPKNWKSLNFKLLEEIKKTSGKFLALHGGSGIPNNQIKKAIYLGVNKINVNSELNWAFSNELKKVIKGDFLNMKNWEDPRNLFQKPYDKLVEMVETKIKLFSM